MFKKLHLQEVIGNIVQPQTDCQEGKKAL